MFHESFRAQPYWWEDFPPVARNGEDCPSRLDVVVVGGGYAGLNAAIHLARRGQRVAILEADRFGAGASGRNAGHVSSGVNLGKGSSSSMRSPLERALAPDHLAQLRQEAHDSFAQLEEAIRSEGISCGYRRSGRIVGAISGAHYRGLLKKTAELAASEPTPVPREQQQQEIASDAFHGSMVLERSGQLHPAAYLHGLLRVAQEAGVHLLSSTRVTAIERAGSGYVARTANRQFAAERLVLATNGYTGRLHPWLSRRIMPVASYIIVTEELSDPTPADLIPKLRTVADTRRLLTYFRPTPDGRRILLGGRATLSTRPAEEVAAQLHQRLVAYFPRLEGVRITHAWSGQIAFTFDFLPHIGERDGIAYAIGCNGSGVAMLSYLGREVGRMLTGEGNSAFARLKFPRAPFYAGKPWFLPLLTSYHKLRDRLDSR